MNLQALAPKMFENEVPDLYALCARSVTIQWMDAHLPGSHLGPLGISWEALGSVLGGVLGALREAVGGSWDLPGTSREAHGASSQNACDFDKIS